MAWLLSEQMPILPLADRRFTLGLLSPPTRRSRQLDRDGAPLRYLSTTGVDSRGLTRTTEDSQEEGKRRLHNPLRPEVMSHQ